jgi:hypothetical protein
LKGAREDIIMIYWRSDDTTCSGCKLMGNTSVIKLYGSQKIIDSGPILIRFHGRIIDPEKNLAPTGEGSLSCMIMSHKGERCL